MKIGIRADGGSCIGMGHIMRTLVLAKELSKNNDVFYICRTENYNKDSNSVLLGKYLKGIEKIKSQGFKVIYAREKHLLEDLKTINADLLITDSYDVNQEYFYETKKIFNKTAYIDDTNLYNFDVHFLINQNIDAEDFHCKVNEDTKLMLGPTYIMLRDEFRNVSEKYIHKDIKDIMVTVGGADPFHVTEKILCYVEKLNYNFHIVVGPSFEDTGELKKFESDKVKLYYNANMCALMQKCDIAVSACGSALYELAACGVPTLGIIIADNQQGIANKLNELGVIKNLGWHNELSKENFIKAIEDMSENYEGRRIMSSKARSIVDGKGAERICKILTA